MSYHIPYRVVLAVEFRVLPFRRFVVDTAYWWWVSFWFAVLPPLAALTWIPWMAGCQGYFEFRDSIDYPAIHRFYSMRWTRWRNNRFPEYRRAAA